MQSDGSFSITDEPAFPNNHLLSLTDMESRIFQQQNRKDLFDKLLNEQVAEAHQLEQQDNSCNHQQQIIEIQEQKEHQGCKCSKIECLKLYCECFARGKLCNKNCICVCCQNKQGNQHVIYKAKQVANFRNAGIFRDVQPLIPIRKCNCKKTFCLKKYCQCYSSGQKCTEHCECFDCHNHEEHDDPGYHSVMQIQAQA